MKTSLTSTSQLTEGCGIQILYDNDCEHIQIDTLKIRQFLLAQGMDKKKINLLRIHVQHAPSAKQKRDIVAQGDGEPWGLYSKPRDVYLFLNDRHAPLGPSLNKTLLHELRHHMKNGYQPGEAKLPHKDRPSEIDAIAFADQHASSHRLLSVAGEREWIANLPLVPMPVVLSCVVIAVVEIAAMALLRKRGR